MTIRRARWREVGALARMYRRQANESYRYHHPYPRNAIVLGTLFAWMVTSQRTLRLWMRATPRLAFVLLVAVAPGQVAPVGYGTIRFRSMGRGALRAQFGYLVDERFRARGIGSDIAVAMYEETLRLGVTIGGGTVLAGNAPSTTIVERFGFHLQPAAERDRRAADGETLEAYEDLRVVLERVHRLRSAEANGSPGPSGGITR